MILRLSQFRVAWVLTAALVVSPAVTLTSPAAWAQGLQTRSAAAQQSPYEGTVVEDILVRVNDQVISRSDYERADQQLQAEAKAQSIPDAELEARRKDLLRDLIDTQLLLSKGKELGVTGETELVKRLDDIRKQNKLDSMEALEKAAADQGVSFEDFKASIRNSIITQSVIRDEVGRRIQLTPSEVQAFYQAHRADFDQPEQVRLSEILIPTTSDVPQIDKSAAPEIDPAKLAEAEATANDVYAKLKAGAKFEDLSKTYSSLPNAQDGGDLGSYKRGILAPALEEKTFPLKAGEITEPIRTKQGFIILKVTEHVQPGAGQFKQIEPQVEEAAYMDRMQPELRKYLTQLREEAYVEIKPGFVDSGASPNQPSAYVYSAYVAPVKKKKKGARTRYRQTSFRSKSRTANTAKTAPAPTAPVVGTSDGSNAATGAAVGTTTGAPNGTTAGTAAPATTTTASAGKPASASTMKAGKKEKIRFGQAPRETLPTAAKTEHEDAGAGTATTAAGDTAAPPAAGTEVAAAAEPANPLEPTVDKGQKKRFADRAKLPKAKKTGPAPDPFAPPPVTTDETATQQTQAAPLGLAGNTAAKPKKVKKTKEEKGDKRRLQDKDKGTVKPATTDAPAATPPASAPAASTPPAETTPAPATQP